MLKSIYPLLVILFLAACEGKPLLTKTIINDEREIFSHVYSKKKYSEDSSFYLTWDGLNKLFNLKPITQSEYSSELRLYYIATFVERLFLIRKTNDSIFIEIYNVGYVEKNENPDPSALTKVGDSIVLRTKKGIKLTGNFHSELWQSTADLPAKKIFNPEIFSSPHSPPCYYFQVKTKDKYKYILFKDCLDFNVKIDDEVQKIDEYIKAIQELYTFRFHHDIDSISETIGQNFLQ